MGRKGGGGAEGVSKLLLAVGKGAVDAVEAFARLEELAELRLERRAEWWGRRGALRRVMRRRVRRIMTPGRVIPPGRVIRRVILTGAQLILLCLVGIRIVGVGGWCGGGACPVGGGLFSEGGGGGAQQIHS